MLSVHSYVRLPEVLEIVIVRRRSTSLDLCQHAPVVAQWKDEVWACARDEPVLRRKDDFLAEAQVLGEEFREVCLNGRTRPSVYMKDGDLVSRGLDVRVQCLREVVHARQICRLGVGQTHLHVPRVRRHRRSLSAETVMRLGFVGNRRPIPAVPARRWSRKWSEPRESLVS